MTHDAVRLTDEVRILELEVQKLEFGKRITQLKAEQLIDDDCIGCCKVVDVAANLQKELDECSNMNLSLHEELDRMKKVHGNRKAHIHNLTYIADALETERDDLKQTLSAASVVIKKMEDDINSLEAELSARKEDSKVLMKVVDVVKNWDDSTGRAFPTLIKILDELVDYTDALEGPPETPIDDLYRVSVFLEMP